MQWILNNFKTFMTIMGSIAVAIVSFLWAFILMGYNTQAETKSNTASIAQLRQEISNVRTEQAESLGVIKSVKDDTDAIRKILYRKALNQRPNP